jgi:bacterial/archaeal transporter family protein
MYALASALAASATAILAKIGIKGVPSNLATAVRTVVVLVFAWAIVFATREHHALRDLKARSVLFLVLSGIGTGASWVAYFKALQMAPASRVAPIDKVSLAFTIILAAVILGESISWKVAVGTALMVAGALLTLAACKGPTQ